MTNSERSKQHYYPALLDIARSESGPGLSSLLSFLENTKGIKQNVNAKNSNGETVLLKVLSCGYYTGLPVTITLLRILLEAGADVNLVESNGISPLHKAASFYTFIEDANYDDTIVELVTLLVEAGAIVGAVNSLGRTPLHKIQHPAVAQYLLDHGGRDCLEMEDRRGDTPLLLSLFSDDDLNACTARVFIQSGADLHTVNDEGLAAVDVVDFVLGREIDDSGIGVVSEKLFEMTEMLGEVVPALHERLGEQSKFDPPSVFGKMLCRVVQEWYESNGGTYSELYDLISPLLEKGADVDYVDPKSGFTTLHHLLNSCDVYPGNDDFLDCDPGEGDWSTPFDEVEFEEEEELSMEDFALEVFNRLHTAKPTLNVSCVTNGGWNVLHYAAKAGFTKLAARLLAVARATPRLPALDVSATTSNGLTPLHVACRRGHKEMAQWLVEEGSPVLATTKAAEKRKPQTPWEIASEQMMDLSSENYRRVMQKQAQTILREHPGLATLVLERLLRSGPAGVYLAFEFLPGIVAPQSQPLKKKLRH